MALAFARWIRRHPDNDRYILSNDYDWTYFNVADVPFFIRGVTIHHAAEEAATWVALELSDGTSEKLQANGLRVSARGALYAQVKEGRFEARFMPYAQTMLAPLLVENEETGRIELRLNGKNWSIAGAL